MVVNLLGSSIRGTEGAEHSPNGVVEECRDLCQLPNIIPTYTTVEPTTIRRIRKRNANNRSEPVGLSAQIDEFFWTHFPIPIDKAPTKVQWLMNTTLIQVNATKEKFKDAVDLFERQIQVISLQQLNSALEKAKPIFGAEFELITRYHERSDSLNKLEYFLEYQLGEEKEDFIEFMFKWLNKKSGKQNCLNIIGPPSSGKTWFARILEEASITSGQIANQNRNTSFAFNNCVNKRLLHWDEPNYEPNAEDNSKMLFSGDELPVHIKYQNIIIIQRTPVICTSNTMAFPTSEAFRVRLRTLRFKSFPTLKEWQYLHPMCLYDLFTTREYMVDEQVEPIETIDLSK